MADIEPAPVVDCTECGTELTPKLRPLCQGCVDDACEAVIVDCSMCGKNQADTCESCAGNVSAERVREWAQRRKMLGLLSPECFAEFELCISDIEAGDA